MRIPITPVPKPRQTRSDKWKKRKCVLEYRAFADELRLRAPNLQHINQMAFYMPMPKSWGIAKRAQMRYTPHRQKPDLDNLVKAILDALFDDDSHIWDLHATKVWAEDGAIELS